MALVIHAAGFVRSNPARPVECCCFAGFGATAATYPIGLGATGTTGFGTTGTCLAVVMNCEIFFAASIAACWRARPSRQNLLMV
jgi:hypothetical protein